MHLMIFMQIKFIDDIIPNNYSNLRPISNLDKIKLREGRQYILLGQSEKTCLFRQRVLLGISALAKTILTLGVWLLSEKTRSDWKSFFTGKKVVAIYSSSPFLARQILEGRNNAIDQNILGFMYEKGIGVEKSDIEAAKYYHLAAAQGNVDAQTNLGFMYEKGLGVEKSDKEAIKYYRLAAAQGNAIARTNLGIMYLLGHGVKQSYEEALKYFLLAAIQNDDIALANLGYMYENGLGVKQSDKEAEKYYRLAVAYGNAIAIADFKRLLNKEKIN